MCYIRLLVPQCHWPHKSLHLHRLSREPLSHERRLRDHPLPRFLLTLTRPHHLEHLVFCNTSNLRQRHSILGSLVFPSLLDRTRQSLCVLLPLTIEQVCWKSTVRNSTRVFLLDVPFVVCLESLFELDFLSVALGMQEFSLQTKGFLSDGRRLVGLTSLTFTPVE